VADPESVCGDGKVDPMGLARVLSYGNFPAAPIFTIRQGWSPSGSAGVARDVQIALSLPVQLRIIDALVDVGLGIGSAFAQVWDAPGGTGLSKTNAMDVGSTQTGKTVRASKGTNVLCAAGSNLYLRLSDGTTGGEINLICVRV
jgi:hypothetical protein